MSFGETESSISLPGEEEAIRGLIERESGAGGAPQLAVELELLP